MYVAFWDRISLHTGVISLGSFITRLGEYYSMSNQQWDLLAEAEEVAERTDGVLCPQCIHAEDAGAETLWFGMAPEVKAERAVRKKDNYQLTILPWFLSNLCSNWWYNTISSQLSIILVLLTLYVHRRKASTGNSGIHCSVQWNTNLEGHQV